MRLAVVSPFVDRQHGTERALAELLERLAYTYGCEVHLYAQRVQDLHLYTALDSAGPSAGSITWHRVPALPGPHLLQFLAWIFLNRLLRRWDTAFHKLSFDLVLSPGINGFDADVVIVHALFHRLKRLSREGKNSNLRSHTTFFRSLHRRGYYALLSRMELRIYKNPRVALATVSQRMAVLLTEYFGRRDAQVIPNGVDTALFSPAARLGRRAESRQTRNFTSDDFVLLLIGNDWSMKGLETVLEALHTLEQLPIQLLVVGNDDPEPFLAKAKEIGVLQRCRWEPPSSNVLDFYSAADLYVSPSREDSFGLPVAEAMACGLPVISSVFAGVSDLIHDGVDGFVLSEPSDAESLARIVRLLCEQSEFRDRIGQAAAKTALEFSWDRNAAQIWAMLQVAHAKTGTTKSTGSPPSGIM